MQFNFWKFHWMVWRSQNRTFWKDVLSRKASGRKMTSVEDMALVVFLNFHAFRHLDTCIRKSSGKKVACRYNNDPEQPSVHLKVSGLLKVSIFWSWYCYCHNIRFTCQGPSDLPTRSFCQQFKVASINDLVFHKRHWEISLRLQLKVTELCLAWHVKSFKC